MTDFILLMHDDAQVAVSGDRWSDYFAMLRERDAFQGGSSIGTGEVVRKDGAAVPITSHLAGYIRIQAKDIDEARSLVAGNPVFEAGGSVEIRELRRD